MFSAAVTGVGLGHVPYILSRMPRATAQAHIHAQYRGEYTGPQYERIQPAVYEQRRTTSVPKISSFTSSPRSPCRHLPTAPAGQHRHPRGQQCLWYNFGAHTPKEKKVAFLCGRCIQIGSGREGWAGETGLNQDEGRDASGPAPQWAAHLRCSLDGGPVFAQRHQGLRSHLVQRGPARSQGKGLGPAAQCAVVEAVRRKGCACMGVGEQQCRVLGVDRHRGSAQRRST